MARAFHHSLSPPPTYHLRRAPPTGAAMSAASCSPSSDLEIVGGGRPLLATFASVRRPYRPFPLLASNRHLETIFAAFFRSLPDVAYRRECLRTADGGAVALDWVAGDPARLPADAPTLILLVRFSPASNLLFERSLWGKDSIFLAIKLEICAEKI